MKRRQTQSPVKSQNFWTEVDSETVVDGERPFLAEARQVPGAQAYGATEAEAAAEARKVACETLGERATTRGDLLVEWLSRMAQRKDAHMSTCFQSKSASATSPMLWHCADDCLVLRTQEAVRNDAHLVQLDAMPCRPQNPEAL